MIEAKEQMDKIIPMIRDFMVYEILTDERYKDYTAFIISKIASLDYDFVFNNMTVLNSRHKIRNKESKRAISDIIIKVKNIIINIEINGTYYNGVLEKSHYYYSKLIADSLKINDEYKDIPTIIQINLNDFAVNNNTKKINEYLSMEKDNHDIELSKFRKYHVNMDIIKKECYNNMELIDIEKALVLFEIDSKRKLKEVTRENSMLERVSDRIMEINDDYSYLITEYDCIDKHGLEMNAAFGDRIDGYLERLSEAYRKFDECKEQVRKQEEHLRKQEDQVRRQEEQLRKLKGETNEKIRKLDEANEKNRKKEEQLRKLEEEINEKIRKLDESNEKMIKQEKESSGKIKQKAEELKKIKEELQQTKKALEKYELKELQINSKAIK